MIQRRFGKRIKKNLPSGTHDSRNGCVPAPRSPGRRAWPRRRRVRAARPSADSLLGRLRVGFAWRSPCAALRKAACAEGASGASFGRCAPPAAGGRPCRRSPAPWTGRGGGAAAPQHPLHAGAALCCLVGSMLVLCAVFARRLWRCTASRGEWREARAAPRVARMAPESALDEPAGAARAPCKLAHRLHAAVNSLVDGGQSHDCRSKPAGFVTPFTQSFFGLAFSFAWFYFVFSFAKRQRGGRAGANYGQLHVEGSRTTTRRLGRLGRAAPSRTGRAPYPARRRSHSDV